MVKEISKEDRAYFAGLLDGEGCISISKGVSNKYIAYSLEVAFGLTYKSILLEMQKLFSGNIHKKNMDKSVKCNSSKVKIESNCASPEKWKQVYLYKLSGRDALYFLKVVESFCREKKGQVALGIRYEQGRRSCGGRYGRSDSETERCEFFYKELQRLKHEQLDETETKTDFEDDQRSIFSFVEEE